MNLPVITSTFFLSIGGRFVFSPVKLHPISSSLLKVAIISLPITFRYRGIFEVMIDIWSGMMNGYKDSVNFNSPRKVGSHWPSKSTTTTKKLTMLKGYGRVYSFSA